MDMITSISTPVIGEIRRLVKESSFRRECGNFVAEGYNIVKDIQKKDIVEIFVTNNALAKYDNIYEMCEFVTVVSDKVMGAISDTKTPSGVLAVCKIPTISSDNQGKILLLDNLNDPGNVGTILRTATACGVTEIWSYGNCADIYSPKVVRSSMGGVFHVSAKTVELEDIKGNVMALDMAGENLYSMSDIPNDFILVVGSESHGISAEIKALANRVISLPMSEKMESLNAGVSLSIALYHLINKA